MKKDTWTKRDIDRLRESLIVAGWSSRDQKEIVVSPEGEVARLPYDAPEGLRGNIIREIFSAFSLPSKFLTPEESLTQYLEIQDIFFVGSDFKGVAPGELPIRFSKKFYQRWEIILRQAVAAELSFNPKGATTMTPRVLTFMEGVTLGKTVASSYLQAVHLPLEQYSAEPLGRRVWHRINRGLQNLNIGVLHDTIEPLVELKEDGWTAPMCEQLASLVEDTKAETVKTHAIPNRTLPDLLPNTPHNEVIVPIYETPIRLLTQTAMELRNIVEGALVQVRGIVYELRDPRSIGEDRQQAVSVKWVQEDERPLKIQIPLDSEAFQIAELARMRRQPLSVEGRLYRESSGYVLKEASNVKLYEGDIRIFGADDIADI